MSAAAVQAAMPLHSEGTRFWQEVTEECRRHVQAINRAVSAAGLSDDCLVQFLDGPEVRIIKNGYPSTELTASLSFYSWGPVIQCRISGARDAQHRYLTQEFEMPIARDLDGKIIAIFDEGRSFCAFEVACYLNKIFRRCFPNVTMPAVQAPDCGAAE
jgi:hypothetical protein